MPHSTRQHKKKKQKSSPFSRSEQHQDDSFPRLELVIKGDTDGCEEAVCKSIETTVQSDVRIKIKIMGAKREYFTIVREQTAPQELLFQVFRLYLQP